MNFDKKYLVLVLSLGILAGVFGVVSIAAPEIESSSPQQSSSLSIPPYYITPPNFDSGWINTTKCGQCYNIAHGLNTTEVFVDIKGKQTLEEGEHQRDFGLVNYPAWSMIYGVPGDDRAESIVRTSDGGYTGYALGGYAFMPSLPGPAYSFDFRLVVAHSNEDMEWGWAKTYGGVGDDRAYSVQRTDTGGYILAGYTSSYGVGGLDFWLVKTDSSGNALWNKTYGGQGHERAYSIIQTSDIGFAVAGSTNSSSSSYDFWVVKTDSDGISQWNATFGGTSDDGAYSIIQTKDGGYAIAGYSYSVGQGNGDVLLIKTDSTGNMQWNQTYGGDGNDEAYSLVQTDDGGYALAGHTNSFGLSTVNFWLVKTDANGNLQWNKTYGHGEARSISKYSEGGYCLAGNGFATLVKTDVNGTLQWSEYYPVVARSVVQSDDGGFVVAGVFNFDFWLAKPSRESGLTWTNSTRDSIIVYRGTADDYWNYVRVRVWIIKVPTWQYGDINQDGVVDAKDLYIVSKNYGKTFSLLSLGGIVAISGVQTIRTRKQRKTVEE